MKIIIEKDNEAISLRTVEILMGEMLQDKRVNLSITAGASPARAYEILMPMLNGRKDLGNVHYYTFDNVMLDGTGSEGWVGPEMRKAFFTPAGVAGENIHILTDKNYATYDAEIEAAGGLDLMFVGLGADGHFCANMPYSTDFTKGTHAYELKPEYPWYNALESGGYGNIPKYMYTMGAVSLMKARRLLMIVNGEKKAEAVKQFLESPVDHAFPSSVLKLHPNFTLLLDKDGASLICDGI